MAASLLAVAINVNAQPASDNSKKGKIVGTVIDAATGQTVIGANVSITGTTKGSATDLDGKFAIRNLTPGTYSVTVSYISYNKKNITGVEVSAGSPTTVNITLQPKTVGMDEVVVTATADQSSSAGLLSIQRKSVPMQDGLSSQQISKLGDGDVGSAIKRVTGVTVQDGKNVFVRGLGNRYSNVQLNGSQLPSTNPNKKEAPMDLFGSGLVSNIIVQKTFTADQSAEFSGGSVQITTREFPEERNFTLSYSTSYNTVSTLENTLTSGGSSTDFLGYDNGKRQLPSVLNSQRVSDQNAGQVANGLHNSWGISSNQSAIPSQSISVNYANQFNEDKMPIGVVSNFSYKYARELEPNKVQRFIQFFNEGSPNFLTDYNQTEGVISADLSGMLNIFVKPSPVTKIGLKSLYSNSTSDTKSIIQGPYQNGVNRLTILNFDRRTVFSNTLEMETYFQNFLSSTLTANVSFNSAKRIRPDRRTTRYNLSGNEYSFAPFGDNNGHFFSNQKDNNYAAKLKYKFEPADFLSVSTGGNVILKDRRFTARRISYRDQVAPFIDEATATQSPDVLFNDEQVENGTLEMVETTQFGTTQSDWYDGFQSIYAGFISTQWNAIDRLSFEVGGRIENSVQTIEVPLSLDGEYQEVSEVDNTDFLPAVNVTYEVSDRTNLRAAFSRTLARPEFREISNFNFADFFGGQRIYGNPDLERTRITNYDLRFETYPSGGELFALSAFYKQFENPIELFYRLTDANEVFYDNAPEADLFGVEVEGRKNITDRLQVVANASYIFSETDMGSQASNRVANITRPMVGQSPYIINVSSFYTIPKWDMNLSLSYNTFGERIVTVGKNGQQYDEYEEPFHDLGAKIEYPLGRVDLSLEASNLLNQEREYTQGPATTFRYKPGVTLQLGAKLSL
ncbi:TonB-dependent receptor [Fodinibius salsisoli]|uniref:TonB-dependent receptor n=1 Tax=Fodinibius salsisoli TaxID=2820877 RepID=A0ABT3PR87_9BACT|nr:TonB-dependent receptor [Fodinibius salsisoli]MCW9708379.1 TonB-dependent receptor [Fodinibius salsisoli]